jgi:hypothetical protein
LVSTLLLDGLQFAALLRFSVAGKPAESGWKLARVLK